MKRETSIRIRFRLLAITLCMAMAVALGCHAKDEDGRHIDKTRHSFPVMPDTIILDGCKTIVYYHPQLDEDPQYPGGMAELMHFLSKNITYQDYGCHSVEGRNITKILIDKEGNVRQAQTEQSLWKPYDDEVIRICYLMPQFRPAILKGDSVASWFYLPVIFRDATP